MSIAIFKPFIAAAGEGERVWEKLVQKIVSAEELAAHIAAGWFTDANEALTEADTAQVEKENASLQAQINDAQEKLDGRTKAGKAAKAAATDAAPSSTEPVAASAEAPTADAPEVQS